MRHGGPHHPEQPEHVGLELQAHLGVGDEVHRASHLDPGIVHDHVQTTEAGDRRVDAPGDRGVVVDVEGDHVDPDPRLVAAARSPASPLVSRMVATTSWPRPASSTAVRRPKPLEQPVIRTLGTATV